MVDRLAELHLGAGTRKSPGVPRTGGGGDDEDIVLDDMGDAAAIEEGRRASFMPEFYDQVNAIKRQIAQIQSKVTEIEEIYGRAAAATSTDEMSQLSARAEALTREIDSISKTASVALKQMDGENAFIRGEKYSDLTENRARGAAHSTCTRKFMEAMKQFYDAQADHKERMQKRQERQVKIVMPEATDEEVARIVAEGGAATMMQRVVGGSSHAAAKNALLDVQDRYRDILELERSISELRQLFVDMAVLVDKQGELLDQIEHNVGLSVQYTEGATQELIKANKSAKSSRKKMCCIVVVALIILVVLVAVLGGVLPGALKKA